MTLNDTLCESNITSNKTLCKVFSYFFPLWWYPALHGLSAVLFLVGVPINCIIIYLVKKLNRLHKPAFYYVASLAVADFLVLLWMMISVHIDGNVKIPFEYHRFVIPSFDMFLAAASMLNVAIVSVDRAIAVIIPLHYEQYVTNGVARKAIISVWTYSVLVFILAMIRIAVSNSYYQKGLLYACILLSFLLPVSVIALCYIGICACAFRNLKFTEKWERTFFSVHRSTTGVARAQHLRLRAKGTFRELRVTGNLLIIVLPFTIGWSYYIGTQIHEEFNEGVDRNIDMIHEFFMFFTPWLLSSLNPILYFCFTRAIRQGFFKVLRKKWLSLQNNSNMVNATNRSQVTGSSDILECNRHFQDTLSPRYADPEVLIMRESVICQHPTIVYSPSHIEVHLLDKNNISRIL